MMELFWMKLGLLTYTLILFLLVTFDLSDSNELPESMFWAALISLTSSLSIFIAYHILNLLMGDMI